MRVVPKAASASRSRAIAFSMLSGDEFAAVLKSPNRRRSGHFSLHWCNGATSKARLGLVVPKRLARTAVRRNLIKRQARALFVARMRVPTDRAPGRAAPDVVLKLTAGLAGLGRGAQFAELGELMKALPGA